MDEYESIGEIEVTLKADEDGYIGRQCPQEDCRMYFKVRLPEDYDSWEAMTCCYCGHKADLWDFLTSDQDEYISSLALEKAYEHILGYAKRTLEFDYRPTGALGIGLSVKVKGEPIPIRYYSEKELETPVTCSHCGLEFVIYGLFGYCPRCGAHGSYQYLLDNFAVAEKQTRLVERQNEQEARENLKSCLRLVVTKFQTFADALVRANAEKAKNPEKARNVNFQRVDQARTLVQAQFGFDFARDLSQEERAFVMRGFQKRHLIAHKDGVIDKDYVLKANDPEAVPGRLMRIDAQEVSELIARLREVGNVIYSSLSGTAEDTFCGPTRPMSFNAPESKPRQLVKGDESSALAEQLGIPLEAFRTAKLLSERSEYGYEKIDQPLGIEDLMAELDVNETAAEDAIYDLKRKGFIELDEFVNVKLRVHPLNRLFWETDQVVKGWKPKEDAVVVAEQFVKGKNDLIGMDELISVLKWEPRRLNPAVTWLIEHDCADSDEMLGEPQYAYPWLRNQAKARLFLRDHRK